MASLKKVYAIYNEQRDQCVTVTPSAQTVIPPPVGSNVPVIIVVPTIFPSPR